MAQKLSVTLTGDLDVRQNSACAPGGITDVGCGFKLSLSDINCQADIEISQKLAVVDAGAAPVALPFPGNLEGTVLYFKVLSGGPFDLVVNHQTQGPTSYPLKHLIVMEPSDDEKILGLTIASGEGSFEWIVTGDEA